MPVIVYVYPSGARAASAGVIIAQAAHVAAMAPGTNIGAAHPVAIGIGGSGEMDKTMSKKVENDAAAYARSIAKTRGRSEEWVEKAVRKSESITADEALKLKVIDVVAPDIEKLLAAIDQKEVIVAGNKRKISTAHAVLNTKKMGTRQGILAAISNPNIAYLLLLIGLAGLYFEFSTPGAILPGVIGGISLLSGFFRSFDPAGELYGSIADFVQYHFIYRGDKNYESWYVDGWRRDIPGAGILYAF